MSSRSLNWCSGRQRHSVPKSTAPELARVHTSRALVHPPWHPRSGRARHHRSARHAAWVSRRTEMQAPAIDRVVVAECGPASTHRTQCRTRVVLVLASIHQAAKLDCQYPRWEPYAGKLQVRVWCSEASCHSSGWKSRQQRSPVAVVVISSNGKGNRSVESLEVKASEGRAYRSDPYRGASNLAGRSKCVNREAPKYLPRVKRIAGRLGVPSRSDLGEGDVGIEVWTGDDELPGVIESGMPRRNGQRKPGTTRGSPRRSRTAKALRISRHAVKS